ncbi:hypothetical protein NQ318_019293 [Aromia moschata]|uniref:Rab-GAP TBC domain-containing protein n=1 Tax=Aromia moschata TaxID=1265417 RepID=A0AAV8X4V1_9CUCU|nr:hypothetical protein NQ318_019293 [Aromia moschata]
MISQEEFEDNRSELKFDKTLESEEEKDKRSLIEEALNNEHSTLKTWQNFAISKFGLVADDLRHKIWPLLLEVDPSPVETIPSLEELSSHSEYQQVVLDAFHISNVLLCKISLLYLYYV